MFESDAFLSDCPQHCDMISGKSLPLCLCCRREGAKQVPETSNVPPPRSNTSIVSFFFLSKPYAKDAAVGSLMILSTSSPVKSAEPNILEGLARQMNECKLNCPLTSNSDQCQISRNV
jgi:hypothetical protein